MADVVNEPLTSNTTPAPWLASDSLGQSGNNGPWRLFDKLYVHPLTMANTTIYPQWLQLQKIDSLIAPDQFRFRVYTNPSAYSYPATFELLYSGDGATWNSAGSHSQADTLAPGDWSPYFPIAPNVAAEFWRLRIDSIHVHGSGSLGGLKINELELDGVLGADVSIDGSLDDATAEFVATTPFGCELLTQTEDATAEFVAILSSVKASMDATTDDAVSEITGFLFPSPITPQTSFYQFVITGAADGLADAIIPATNFHSTSRDSTSSYLQVTVPDLAEYSALIAERPNGTMILYSGVRYLPGGEEMLSELARAPIDNNDAYKAVRSASRVLSGTLLFEEPLDTYSILLPSGTTYTTGTGGRTYTTIPVFRLKGGDTVTIPETGEFFTAGQVTVTVGENDATMTVTDGDG